MKEQINLKKIRQEFVALVIYNEADNFSVGANLKLLTTAINRQSWHEIEVMITEGQETFGALKYAPFPVVGAPSGLALGGGCEVLLHCDAIEAHSELYMGLVEVGVGLIPGWGGCKEYLHRCLHKTRKTMGPMPAIINNEEIISPIFLNPIMAKFGFLKIASFPVEMVLILSLFV